MKRSLFLVIVVALLLAPMAGCKPTPTPTPTRPPATAVARATAVPPTATPPPPTATPGPTPTKKPLASKEGTLTIWIDQARVAMIENLGKKFTERYGVPVAVQELGFGDVRDQLKIAGPAGEGPDIIIGAHDWLGELVANGLLAPLDLGEKAKQVDPVAIKAFTYGGKLYGLGYNVEAIALIYNKDLVGQPPKTWDELKAIAKKLQDEKKVDQGYVLHQGDPYHTYPIFTGFGGYVFGRDAQGSYNPQDLGLDGPGGKAAARELDSMIKAGLLRKDVNWELMMNLFKTGRSAMFITGPWALKDVREAKVNYGIAKIPTMKQTPRPFVGVQGFMVSAFGKNRLLAQTFLTEFVATDEGMQMLYDAVPAAPAWLPLQPKVKDPDLAIFAQSAADGDPMPAIPQMSAVWEAWGKAVTLIFQQQQDPDKAMEDAGTAIRQKISASGG